MRDVYPSESHDAAKKAFSRARREAILRHAWARARHGLHRISLEPFADARSNVALSGVIEKVPLGTRKVSLSDIRGSVSRSRDFDDRFLPLNNGLRERWEVVYKAFQHSSHLGTPVPPISLYMVGDRYFVRDGNHRVSVALFRGSSTIEADITLLHPTQTNPHTSGPRLV